MLRDREWWERQTRDNLEEYRRKELERIKNCKIKQNPNTFKCKHREAVRRWHINKHVFQKNSFHTAHTHSCLATPKLWKQSIGKAVEKVDKVLPKSPCKKKVIVRVLAKSMGLISKEKNKHNKALPDVLIDTVKKFYLWEDIACFKSSKQDVVTIRDEN